ncbi:translation factor GTPase family protein [Streptomyces sp. NPDC001941]|uniref:translation factor GTPase family protein n=1 Tax=Streptomyces sp. NPDC001941 TaxID=3154659 RepID=UPI00332A14FB
MGTTSPARAPRVLNLGILAHIDAGKTSLTERLLYAAGVIDEIGSVDDGSTRTDSLELERRRGITIKSAVVSFPLGGTTVNLIDTPGHPDFIAEVERVLGVLDGAVLVVSAVEGVQAQTRVLMRTLRRLAIPTLLFVNKVDRRGADPRRVLAEIRARLTPDAVALGAVRGAGTPGAAVTAYGADDPGFTDGLAQVLAEHDEEVLAAYVEGAAPPAYPLLRARLAALTGRSRVHPVLFGSAITGAGLAELGAGIEELLPAATGDPDGAVSGTVFKVERGPAGEKVAYVRLFSGTVATRDVVALRDGAEGKVTGLSVFEDGASVRRPSVEAGRIARVWGLGDVRIGDPVGERALVTERHHFAPPTLETVVEPERPGDRAALHLALTQLAEQDPLIGLRHDPVRGEVSVSLYGEVQKEVVQATLAEEFGVEVTFRETTTICVEQVTGSGEAVEFIDKDPNPFLATVGLRVEPAPDGAGVDFRLGVELGAMPYAFFRAVEETVRETLGQGLRGWRVPDCVVTMTHSGYWPRQSHAHAVFDKSMSSTAGDFRLLTPLVLTEALRRAGTRVLEPVHRFRLELPPDALSPVLSALARLRAVPEAPEQRGGAYVLEGEVPAARVHELTQVLPGLTRGEGVVESRFARYGPVAGAPPSRSRTDDDPLHRKEYLLRVVRRV